MREIKLRIWANGKYYYSNGAPYINVDSGGHSSVAYRLPFLNRSAGHEYIVEQWTGLKDRNGKDIYEGDILGGNDKEDLIAFNGQHIPNDDYPYDWWERGVVEYYDKHARFGMFFYSPYGGEGYTGKEQHIEDYLDRWYVMGNIHENADLLKAGPQGGTQ